MVSSSLDALLMLSKTTFPQKLFQSECITLYAKNLNVTQATEYDQDHEPKTVGWLHSKRALKG